MSLAIGAGIAGGAILGGLIGGGSAAAEGAKARKFAKKEGKRARKHQTKMYSRRYRRTVADMEAAGLNPILAYRQGAGSAPGGATASAPIAQTGQAAAAGAARGIDAAIGMATAKKIRQDTATSAAQQAKIQKETVLLSKEEPWALIMEQVANEGVKPLLNYLIETYGSGRKQSKKDEMFQSIPPTWGKEFNKQQRKNQSNIKRSGQPTMFPAPVPPVNWRQYK